MRPRRVYLPLSPDGLVALARDRSLAAPARGFAATPGRADPRRSTSAEEEAEYAAFAAAAALAHESDPGQRRIVVAADAPASILEEVEPAADGPTGIVTTAGLPLRFIVSVHIDEADAGSADPGSADPGSADPLDLLWYDITELDAVLEDLASD